MADQSNKSKSYTPPKGRATPSLSDAKPKDDSPSRISYTMQWVVAIIVILGIVAVGVYFLTGGDAGSGGNLQQGF